VDPKSDEKPVEIWTPDEKVDDNTKRMAWLLFLECWKQDICKTGYKLDDPPFSPGTAYEGCLTAAKIIREIELKS
jgi:hypothetical protein